MGRPWEGPQFYVPYHPQAEAELSLDATLGPVHIAVVDAVAQEEVIGAL